jgi:hypothetical protein
MRVESVDAPLLPELRAMVARRLRAYGAFDGCTAKDRRTILAQTCSVLDTMARLCPDVIAAWRMRPAGRLASDQIGRVV